MQRAVSEEVTRSREQTRPSGPDETASHREPTHSRYLVVFEGSSSSMFPLPQSGEVLIGRGETAGLRLDEADVSRAHAKILVTPTEARVADLESHNGTFVNGERIIGMRPLA